MAARGSSGDPKVTALRESRCLNPHPDRVTDEAFLAEEFFDARDAVQVKYEMVRRITVDGAPVTATAAAFGYSRPSYYQAAAALAESGSEGLVPARPGPRGGHKLTEQILTWAEQRVAADPALKPADLTGPIAGEFGGARAPPLRRARASPPPGALQRPRCQVPPSGSLPYFASSSLALFSAADPGLKLPIIALGPRSRSVLEKVIVRLAWSYQTSISNFTPLVVGSAMRPDGNGRASPPTSHNYP
jgi:hypothetical protein